MSRALSVRSVNSDDDDVRIILGPQRRGFGTGCHVVINSSLKGTGASVDVKRDLLVFFDCYFCLNDYTVISVRIFTLFMLLVLLNCYIC